jgi:hypothetical protein
LIGIPASAYFKNPMTCSSRYLLFFMFVILHGLTDFLSSQLVRPMGGSSVAESSLQLLNQLESV